jgi:hypothetical protein
MEKFSITLHRDPEPTPVQVWGKRLFGVLRALQNHAGVERVLHWESRQDVQEVAVEPEAVTSFLRSRPVSVDDAGVPHPEAGIVTIIYGVGPGGVDDDLCEIGLSTGERGPTPNWCRVRFRRRVSPDGMPGLFEDCIQAFSPVWAALETRDNVNERLDEEEEAGGAKVPAYARLGWHTYYGRERAAALDLDALRGRDDVIVRPMHQGVEVVLGERWESNEALRAGQRELEPILFGERTAS